MIEGIRKLPPATTMTVKKDGTITQRAYWRLNFERDSEEEQYTFDDWKRYLSTALMAAVKRRLVADVPVGVLLSGGLDSKPYRWFTCRSRAKRFKNIFHRI